MDSQIYREAKKLTKLLLDTSNPKGKVPAVKIIPCSKTTKGSKKIPCYVNPQTMTLLYSEGVLKLINTLKKNKDSSKFAYKVSLRRDKAEDFLFLIKNGDFSLDTRFGTWSYKDRSYIFKKGTGQYRLVDMFMKNPNRHFSEDEIISTYITSRKDAPKRLANDLIKEIKAPLKIPKKYFVASNGYTFRPLL
ncbi:hypothetical protein HY439_03645 [Candidatus Microgenomates bacterium]|nr:hypothetical protein [Candidatus Microgenomates bacterium]